jgi:hypothetical protein
MLSMTLTWGIQTAVILQLKHIVLMLPKQQDDEPQKDYDAKPYNI